MIAIDRARCAPAREQHDDEHDVQRAEQEHRHGHPDLQSGVLAEGGGSGHLMKDVGRLQRGLINI